MRFAIFKEEDDDGREMLTKQQMKNEFYQATEEITNNQGLYKLLSGNRDPVNLTVKSPHIAEQKSTEEKYRFMIASHFTYQESTFVIFVKV